MYQGMVEKDASILREVLAPEFVLVHMTGMRQPLEAFSGPSGRHIELQFCPPPENSPSWTETVEN